MFSFLLVSHFLHVQEKTDEDVPMPTFFHFIALLAFKIFAAEQVYDCISFIIYISVYLCFKLKTSTTPWIFFLFFSLFLL